MKRTQTIIGCLVALLIVAVEAHAGLVRYTYDAADRVVGVDYGNTTNTTYTYDANGNLLQETTAAATDANLSISKSAPGGPIAAGTPLTYNLTVTNHGPHAASGVIVSDVLPFGITLQSALASQGSCTVSGQTVICSLGVMAPGAAAGVTVTVLPAFDAVFTNAASVALAQIDAVPGNNVDDAVTTVSVAVDSDGDDLPDWWEQMNFGGVTNADKSADSDGDGVTDGDEFGMGTDPHDASQYLTIEKIENQPPVRVEWPTSPIRSYTLQYTLTPTNGAGWTDLESGIQGNGQTRSGVDTNATAPRRVYRVKTAAP